VTSGDLDVSQRDAGVEGGHDEGPESFQYLAGDVSIAVERELPRAGRGNASPDRPPVDLAKRTVKDWRIAGLDHASIFAPAASFERERLVELELLQRVCDAHPQER
jgi:hypothetical protein